MRRYLGAVHNLDCRPAFGLNSASRSWNRDSYPGFLEKRAGDAEEDKTVQRFSTDGSSCTHTDVRTCVERRFETDLRPGRRRGEEGGPLTSDEYREKHRWRKTPTPPGRGSREAGSDSRSSDLMRDLFRYTCNARPSTLHRRSIPGILE